MKCLKCGKGKHWVRFDVDLPRDIGIFTASSRIGYMDGVDDGD
jgi:hypothetical protein